VRTVCPLGKSEEGVTVKLFGRKLVYPSFIGSHDDREAAVNLSTAAE
jgi:hypothetical protein